MYYLDPLPTQCDKCGRKDKYDIEVLRSLKATCNTCGASLSSTGESINKNLEGVRSFADLIVLVMAIDDKLNLDICDEDLENIENLKTVDDLVSLISAKQKGSASKRELLELAHAELKNVVCDIPITLSLGASLQEVVCSANIKVKWWLTRKSTPTYLSPAANVFRCAPLNTFAAANKTRVKR